MAFAKTLYFPEVGPSWEDWIQVINVGNERGKVTGIARDDSTGKPTWSDEKTLSPFQCWNADVESIKEKSSMEFNSDQPIVAERHMHKGTNVLDFTGASVEDKTAGRHLFFPEVYSGGWDWFRFLNIGENDAMVSMIIRDKNARIVKQLQHTIHPLTCWDVDEKVMGGQVTGTIEVQSTQPLVGERHLHYQGGKTTIAQFGQVIGEGETTLYFPEIGPAWNDWVQIVNVGNQRAKVSLIARNDGTGQPTWSDEKELNPFQCWTPNVEAIKVKSSLEANSSQPIAGERHMHQGTSVIDLRGASVKGGEVGKRLFFGEIYAGSGALDWFRFLNVGENTAMVSMIIRDRNGKVLKQLQHSIPRFRCWDVDDKAMGQVTGTVEVQSTQPIIGERHMHYKGRHKGAVVGEYGQVIG